ncbi:MAG: MFS transporter [Chloroflexota bacterium]
MSGLTSAMERFVTGDAGEGGDLSESGKLKRNMRINTIHGVLQIAAINMVQPFLSIFALKLGASNTQVALLSSGPAVVSLFAMIPGAIMVDRQDKKKRLTRTFMFAHRAFFLALACIPLFNPSWRAWTLVTLVALMNFPGSMSNTAWQSFISRIIPADKRAVAFADRNKLMNLIGTGVVYLTGLILDRLRFPVGYQIMFVAAFVMALLELRVFNYIDEDAAPAGSGQRPAAAEGAPVVAAAGQSRLAVVRGRIQEALAQPRFVRYVLASMLFYLAWQVPWPLFSLYQVKVLGANNQWVSILNLMNTGGSLVGYGFWVGVMRRHGNLKALFYSTIWIFVVPAVYAFSHNLWTIAVFNMLTGAIFSGVNLALFNALLEATPERNKTSYIAYYNTAITVSAIIAPMIGVGLLNFMNYMWAFIACAVLRVLGALCFLFISNLEEREARQQHGLGAPAD